ncbi:hypothetical protein Tco_0421736 [Tanacetum coccineum]
MASIYSRLEKHLGLEVCFFRERDKLSTGKSHFCLFAEGGVLVGLSGFLSCYRNVDEHAFINFIFNNQEDPGTWIEARSDKESPKAEINADMVPVNTNEEVEELVGDEFEFKRREKGNGVKETRDTPSPTPIRSPRTHIAPLSIDKKNFNELSEMLYQALKEMLPSMVNKEINKIAMMNVPIYVTEGLLLERQKE